MTKQNRNHATTFSKSTLLLLLLELCFLVAWGTEKKMSASRSSGQTNATISRNQVTWEYIVELIACIIRKFVQLLVNLHSFEVLLWQPHHAYIHSNSNLNMFSPFIIPFWNNPFPTWYTISRDISDNRMIKRKNFDISIKDFHTAWCTTALNWNFDV